MKVLINNKLMKELESLSNKDLKEKTFRYLKEFENYFTDLNNFNSNKIKKLHWAKSNLYVLKIDMKYRLIFTAEYDSDNILNVAILSMAKHDDYESMIYKMISE